LNLQAIQHIDLISYFIVVIFEIMLNIIKMLINQVFT